MSKIPFIDESIRVIMSAVDIFSGNEERVKPRWDKYYDDSVFGTAAASVGNLISSAFASIAGNTDAAAHNNKEALKYIERLGATSASALYQTFGIAAQSATFGFPNPISGAFQGAAAGMNKVIDEEAGEGIKPLNLHTLASEGTYGFAKGAASSGGLIPYAGKLVDNELRRRSGEVLRPEQERLDHAQEWGTSFLNAVLSFLTFGVVGDLKSGVMNASEGLTWTEAIETIVKIGPALIAKELDSAGTRRKMETAGFTYTATIYVPATGMFYAVFCDNCRCDILIPLPVFADFVGARARISRVHRVAVSQTVRPYTCYQGY